MQKIFKIKNKRGLKLAVKVDTPSANGKYPAVIIFPGMTGYMEEIQFVSLIAPLIKQNIAVVRFDYSGYGKSEGSLEEDYLFDNFLGDADVVYKFIKSNKYLDKTRLGLLGNSMGGQIATLLASKHNEFKALCLVSTPDCALDTDLQALLRDWKKKGYFEKKSSRHGLIRLPYSFLENYSVYKATDYIESVNCSLLVISGGKDRNVPPKSSLKIYNKANKPKEYIEIKNMDHYYKRNPAMLGRINIKIVEFFNKNLQL